MTMDPNEKFEGIKKFLPENFGGIKKYLTAIIVILLMVVIIGLLVHSYVTDTPIYIITKLYNYAVNKIISMTGLSQWLVKGIVIIVLIPLLWVIPKLIRGEQKKQARAVGMLYIGVFFLSLYFMSKDTYFSHSGDETLKWYAIREDGVWYTDTPGRDPVSGKTLLPVTPEVISNLKLWEKGKGDMKIIEDSNFPFFNPLTRNAQAWYYKYPDGTLEFWNKPGYHPTTGEELIAVTKQVVFEWKESQAKKASQKPEPAKPGVVATPGTGGESPAGVRSARVGPSTAPEKRVPNAERLKLLINQGVIVQTGKPNVAIVLKGSGTEAGSALESAANAIGNSDKIHFIPRYFSVGSFISEGYFDEIYNGNMNLLQQSNAMSKLDYLILGKLNYTFKKGSQYGQELVSCDLKFSYKIINKDAHVTKSDSKSVIGPAFSEDAALERALEILNEKHVDNILNL